MGDADIRSQVLAILADPSVKASFNTFTNDYKDMLGALQSQVGGLLQDRSLAAATNSAQWLNGVSIVNGTVTAPAISVSTLDALTVSTGALNVTGSITAAAAFPAVGARIVIDSAGLSAYDAGVRKRSFFSVDGSGYVGSATGLASGAAISWDTTGATAIKGPIIIGTGSIADAQGSSWTASGITLAASGVLAPTLTWGRQFFTEAARIQAQIAGGVVTWQIDAKPDLASNKGMASLGLFGINVGGGQATLSAYNQAAAVQSYLNIDAGTPQITVQLAGSEVARWQTTGRALLLSGQLYPGTGAANQATGFLDWSGTKMRVQGSDLEVVGHDLLARRFYPNSNGVRYIDDDGVGFLRVVGGGLDMSAFVPKVAVGAGATGAPTIPAPTHFLTFKDAAGALWEVPAYSAVAPWAA